MVKVTYIEHDGEAHEVDLEPGTSLMRGARDHGIAGIRADCGGDCACSTCHAYIAPGWIDRLPPKEEMEEDMLEFAWSPDPLSSRLTCQIRVTPEMEGLVLNLPERQA